MVTLTFFGLLGCSDKETPFEEASSGTLSVLTYNIHGLPPAITNDDTTGRIEQLAPLLSEYDIVGVQEDWMDENRSLLIDGANLPHVDVFDEQLSEDKVYGAGLTFLSTIPHTDTKHVHYDRCNGYTDSASDCFASKGLQVVSTKLDEQPLHFLNTHLEAGGQDVDTDIRSEQVDSILSEIGSLDGAIIVMGDFNLHPDDPIDMAILERLTDAGLSNACWELDCAEPNNIDQIWYRSGDALTLTLESWERPTHFVDAEGVDLSDHPPIVGVFGWESL